MIKEVRANSNWCLSLLTWIIGKILALNGYFITSIVFEAVFKVSGSRQ